MSENSQLGILVLAYGTPEKPEDIEPYYTHIRGGRPASPESVQNLQERYRLVGGRTPLRTEHEGRQDFDWQSQRAWKVVNDNTTTGLGTAPAYKLVPGGATRPDCGSTNRI